MQCWKIKRAAIIITILFTGGIHNSNNQMLVFLLLSSFRFPSLSLSSQFLLDEVVSLLYALTTLQIAPLLVPITLTYRFLFDLPSILSTWMGAPILIIPMCLGSGTVLYDHQVPGPGLEWGQWGTYTMMCGEPLQQIPSKKKITE